MSTTLNRNVIVLPLPTMNHDRAAFLYTALDNGWVRVQYRKADGTRTSRVCTRNPTLVKAYGTAAEVKALRDWESDLMSDSNVLYWDYLSGGLRSFLVWNVECCGIDAECLEINH
jgi:WYL_2, Sm-like SH3 beta-barrel fold